MLTTLIFSLVLAHNNLSGKDPREYKCRVENVSEISGSVRSLTVILQAPGIAAAKGELSRTPKVITLECFGLQNPVRVNVLYWEEVHRDLTNQTAETCTLQSLGVAASADRKPAPGHTCLLLTHHRESPQRKFIFSKKVFLAGTLNYITTANLPKLEVSGEGLTVPHVHQEKQTLEKKISSSSDKDMLNRRKISIVIKVFIACILLAFAIPYIAFCICEVPCPDQELMEQQQELAVGSLHPGAGQDSNAFKQASYGQGTEGAGSSCLTLIIPSPDRGIKIQKVIVIHETYP